MSDPNLPEGVTQADIDRTVGETIDNSLCEHEFVICENCEKSMSDFEKPNPEIAERIKKIKEALENSSHPAGCAGFQINSAYKTIFSFCDCDCAIGDALHQIGMLEE